MRIEASKALYIKLGEGGEWEPDCIRDGTVRIGWPEVSDALCRESRWEAVAEQLAEEYPQKGVVARYLRNLRDFYEADETVLWITFHMGLLWWCFSERDVTVVRDDNSKTRPVLGKWRSDDMNGSPLQIRRLSGKLTMLQGFPGTICKVRELPYLLRKINGEPEPEVEAATSALAALVDAVEKVIQRLQWKDFEVLVDLILRGVGWRRTSELGGTKETLDLELESPVSADRYGVQVKSQAGSKDLEKYRERVRGRDFRRCYFIVHSPRKDLQPHLTASGDVEVLGPRQLAEWSVRYGLVDWIIGKAG